MERRMTGNEYRTTVVCVDAYENGVLQGHLSNPALEDSVPFQSLMGFFREMEHLLDETQLPQSFMALRSFRKSAKTEESRINPLPEPNALAEIPVRKTENTGKLATFSIRVLFRQSASWQGIVTWLEEEREEEFRSALELALLMDSALCREEPHREP